VTSCSVFPAGATPAVCPRPGLHCRYSFPFDLVTRAWDIFLAEGWKAVFRVAIAFLKLHESALLEIDSDEVGLFQLCSFDWGPTPPPPPPPPNSAFPLMRS
jgi:hypothetical protein